MVKTKNHKTESAVSARQDRAESAYSELKKKHGQSYSGPQLLSWARMIVATHDEIGRASGRERV